MADIKQVKIDNTTYNISTPNKFTWRHYIDDSTNNSSGTGGWNGDVSLTMFIPERNLTNLSNSATFADVPHTFICHTTGGTNYKTTTAGHYLQLKSYNFIDVLPKHGDIMILWVDTIPTIPSNYTGYPWRIALDQNKAKNPSSLDSNVNSMNGRSLVKAPSKGVSGGTGSRTTSWLKAGINIFIYDSSIRIDGGGNAGQVGGWCHIRNNSYKS